MPGNSLYLGSKTIVAANGDIDFSAAVLKSNGSILTTHAEVAAAAITAATTAATADASVRTDFAAADNIVRAEFAAADNIVRAEFAAADVSVRAEFAAADVSVRADFAAADTALDAKITSLLHNIDPVALDSFTEVVAQAKGMTGISLRSSTKLPLSASVYADAKQPIAKELSGLTGAALGYDGWHFTNQSGGKINWYVPPTIGMKNSDIKALVIDNFVINPVSAVFVTVYTKRIAGKTYPPDELPLGGSSWYKCRRTFIVDYPNAALVSGPSSFTIKIDATAPDAVVSYNHKKVDMVIEEFPSRYRNAAGSNVDLPEDEIMFFSIGTDSGSAAGNVSTIVSAFRIQQSSGVSTFTFENADVLADHMNKKMIALYSTLYQKDIMGADKDFIPI